MLIRISIVAIICLPCFLSAQELEEAHLESYINSDIEVEEDVLVEDLARFRDDPVNINTADLNELLSIPLVNNLQAGRLLSYRKLFGKFISIYELQSIPGWDPDLIRKLLPYITIHQKQTIKSDLKTRLKGGKAYVVLRYGRTFSRGSTESGAMLGSSDKIFMRCRYQFRNLLQCGVTADKDAGEPLKFGNKSYGFDFYSFHLFMRNTAGAEALAIGDFTIQMGQGLIHWQGMAFKKGGEVIQVKRQSPVLKPYTASGEYNFHRGLGVSLRKGNWRSTVFGSYRSLTTTHDSDPELGTTVSSFNTYGLHRTVLEYSRKANLDQLCIGGSAGIELERGKIAVNTVGYQFSLPLLKQKYPYQLYAVKGNKWLNLSVDYSWTFRQVHLFGEFAADPQADLATVAGLMVAPHKKVSFAIVYRNMDRGFQSLMANAFTENSQPGNECGFYSGLSIKPAHKWQIDLYADWYRFPWLKFRVSKPSEGQDYLINLIHKPSKKIEISFRYRAEAKPANMPLSDGQAIAATLPVLSNGFRFHAGYQLSRVVELRSRWEQKKMASGQMLTRGFLWYTDLKYKSPGLRWNVDLRFLYAETDNYDSRLYAYENDVLYAGSISAFSGKGWRMYLNGGYKVSRSIRFWCKAGFSGIGQSAANDSSEEVPSGKTDIKIQVQWLL